MTDCGLRSIIVGALLAGLASAPALEAAHLSWLGHETCPPRERCGTVVPVGFKALGEFAPQAWALADEGGSTEPGEQTDVLITPEGHQIARVTPAFRRRLDAEGAARLRDGRIVNVDERVNGQFRYLVVANAPFGLSAPGYRLMPYRTVAVNPLRVPLGSVFFVPALVGLPLPNGEAHDGFCFAHDSDSELKRTEIVLFVGFDDPNGMSVRRFSAARTVHVYQADATTATTLNRRFRALFNWSG
jgi:hypothetical protein